MRHRTRLIVPLFLLLLQAASALDPCPKGHYCDPATGADSGTCATGTYSPLNSYYCYTAPPGTLSILTTLRIHAGPGRLLGQRRGMLRANAVLQLFRRLLRLCYLSCRYYCLFLHDEGFACDGTTLSICALGTYSTGGAYVCTSCFAPYVCPSRTGTTSCSAGVSG